uniref:DNA topoisomerase 2 n=1 Tax=Marseillevirus LCMAC201 TaxID=2506605 RepID=A0A481YXH1_9VIRU|nr:MAG: DNA topoisomerase II [Marseillevirus LCMAC201]
MSTKKPRYTHLSQRNQILKRPGQHIGSTKNATRAVWLAQTEYDSTQAASDSKPSIRIAERERIVEQDIKYNPGLIHIFYEVLGNAQDNYFRSKGSEEPLKKIDVTVDQETGEVSIWNDGLWIPTSVHEWDDDEEIIDNEEHYEAEIIFGYLNSSSNYDDQDNKRVGGGLHGVGVKLTNIFSTQFKVEAFDPDTGLKFVGVWSENMSTVGKPKVTKLKQKKGYTKITYTADFDRFGVKGYSDEHLAVMRKYCIDCAMITGQKVFFNGEKILVKDMMGYVDHYTGGSRIEFKSKDSSVILCEKPAYEAGLTQISFVNGISTTRGGIHVDEWKAAIFKPLLEKIKTKYSPKGKQSTPLRITMKNLEQYFMIFINCNLVNPDFEGQIKGVMSSPAPEINVPASKITNLMKWDFIEDIKETVLIQGMKELKKTDGKKVTSVSIPKADDANKAGTVKSSECTLFITEGDSAKTFAVKGISAIENGTDWFGVLPVRGKVLNVRGAPAAQINNNKEITQLKKILGLEHGLDYNDDDNFRRLRYGKIRILTDADPDGDHIKGLVINFFQYFYPSLVRREYISSLRTPIVKATMGKKVVTFYYLKDYKEWAEKQTKKFTAKYYKGLGTSIDKEIFEIFEDPRYVQYIEDSKTADTIAMIFEKKRADDRKKWLENYEEKEFVYNKKKGEEQVPLSDFFNNEMVGFSIYDNQRSIPSVVDGLKPSQRKAMFVGLKVLNQSKDYKVAQFAAEVAKQAEYHHAEGSMEQVIIGMAQTFVGSNNIALLYESGQFGCVAPNTPILLWDSSIKSAKDIVTGDKLIGDDGKQRSVLKTVSGIDEMYEITQSRGNKYIVNSKHILTLRYSGHKSIYWKESSKCWRITYYDPDSKRAKYKHVGTKEVPTKYTNHHNKKTLSKEEAYDEIYLFSLTIPYNDIFDICLKDYLNFNKETQHHMKGIINSTCIDWPSQDVPIDPYIFGLWLGDGDFCGRGFTTADSEIVQRWCVWANTIGAEVVHHTNGPEHENYHYGIRRGGSGFRTSIGSEHHSSKTCPGCLSSQKRSPACDWVMKDKCNDTINISGQTIHGRKRTDLNPFREILKKHGLYKNKHIPVEYIYNDKETRLAVLAGFIDTDGTVRKQNNANYAEISQSIKHHAHLIYSIQYIAGSLGFRTSISKSTGMISIRIMGNNVHEIPTILHHKQIDRRSSTLNTYNRAIQVRKLGSGPYCGWYIDGNERFLMGDFTITHNTRSAGGKDAAAARYIFTHLASITRYVLRKEDDPILEYLEDEGKQIEPKYFVPVIPMLLVNGCCGIGTGYSSDVPAFNPLDLVEWIKLWLESDSSDDVEYPELQPWYRGFKGWTERDDENNKRFFHYGEVQDLGKDCYQITELPVGVWTDDYKEHLDTLKSGVSSGKNAKSGYEAMDVAQLKEELGNRDLPVSGTKKVLVDRLKKYDKENGTSAKKTGNSGQLISKWEWHGDAYNVNFKVWTKPGVTIDYDNTKFKLCATESLTNMTAFTPKGGLKKYGSLNDILSTFCQVRFRYYQKRKKYLLAALKEKLCEFEAKSRFISEALEDFELLKQTEDQLFDYFEEQEYWKKEASYRYLTDMPVRTFTTDKYNELLEKIKEVKKEINYVKKKTPKQMWTIELEEFVNAYKKWKTDIETVHATLAKKKIKRKRTPSKKN